MCQGMMVNLSTWNINGGKVLGRQTLWSTRDLLYTGHYCLFMSLFTCACLIHCCSEDSPRNQDTF